MLRSKALQNNYLSFYLSHTLPLSLSLSLSLQHLSRYESQMWFISICGANPYKRWSCQLNIKPSSKIFYYLILHIDQSIYYTFSSLEINSVQKFHKYLKNPFFVIMFHFDLLTIRLIFVMYSYKNIIFLIVVDQLTDSIYIIIDYLHITLNHNVISYLDHRILRNYLE